MRREEAGLALHRRIGRPEIRHVGDRVAVELERRVLVVDHPLFVVVDDPRRLHLPQRRPLGVLLAGLAGRVGAALEDHLVAFDALGARRREIGPAGAAALDDRLLDPERIDEAVLEVLGKVEPVAGDDGAVRVDHPGVALREHPAALAVVGHPVGLQRPALVVELDVADRRHRVVVVVVDDLLRLEEQPVLALAGLHAARQGVVHRALGHGRIDAGAAQQRRRDGQCGDPTPSHTRSRAAPCFEDHYHPSSWYNKARVPSKLPTTAGNQAATAGPTSPEPPRSCISEVAT